MGKVRDAVTVDQAGRTLGVSASTVWRMIRRGEVTTVRDRGRRLVLTRTLADRRRPRDRRALSPLTRDHPIFRMIGAGRGGGATPGARDKHALPER